MNRTVCQQIGVLLLSAFSRLRVIGLLAALLCSWCAGAAYATPVTLTFSGTDLIVIGEFFLGSGGQNPGLVPQNDWQFAPLFDPASGTAVTATVSYDTNQPDTNAGGGYSVYRLGSVSLEIPGIGLSISQSSSPSDINDMQISASASPVPQFYVAAAGSFDPGNVANFSNSVGLPEPYSFEALFDVVDGSLTDNTLPTTPLDWTNGEFSFIFTASDGSLRNVVLDFTPNSPAAPEPSTLSLTFVILSLCLGRVVFSRRHGANR